MSHQSVTLAQLIADYSVQLALFIIIALIVLWLLRHRWQIHIGVDKFTTTTAWRQALLGAGTALVALAITLLPGLIAGGYSPGPGWAPYDYELAHDRTSNAATLTLLFGVQSLFEEALFRAIGLSLLAMLLTWLAEVVWLEPAQRRFGRRTTEPQDVELLPWRRRAWLYSGFMATAVLSVGFGLMHGHNPGISLLATVNIVLAGLWLGLLFWKRVSLLAAWLAHFAWNSGLALLGIPISGFAMSPAPLGFGIEGAKHGLLTGGAFGPEASLPATVAFASLTAWLAWRMQRQLRAAESQTAAAPTASDSAPAAEQAG